MQQWRIWMRRKNLMITGLPGTGKTTLILKLAAALSPWNPVGFSTREIRRDGVRTGFELAGFDGTTRILADAGLKSRFRVGKYGVDVKGFEEYLRTLQFDPGTRIAIIDEIGKMEWISLQFRTIVENLLSSPTLLIATIAMHGGEDFEKIKAREDVLVFLLTRKNRDALLSEILREARAILGG
jgi:nucleoside-triphosphatase